MLSWTDKCVKVTRPCDFPVWASPWADRPDFNIKGTGFWKVPGHTAELMALLGLAIIELEYPEAG